MSRFVKRIIREPLHLLLLPLYFIVHKTFQFRGLLDNAAIIRAFLFVVAGIALLYGIAFLLYRNKLKSAVCTTAIATLFLFFGDIKFSLSNIPVLQTLTQYKFFLPLLLILLIFFCYHLKKRQTVLQLNYYLSLLFVLYFIIDAASFVRLRSRSDKLSITPAAGIRNAVGGTVSMPNIYYILTDGYPSISFQQEVLGMTVPSLDSILSSKKFYLARRSASNYSNTAFSMASVFGMNYLEGIDTSGQMAPFHYNRCMEIVKTSPVIRFLEGSGYSICNLSIFDLEGHPALEKDRFLSASTMDIIFYSSFYHTLKRELFWRIIPGYSEKIQKELFLNRYRLLLPQKKYNQVMIDSVRGLRPGPEKPFFVYLHLKMPHFPYFYDSSGAEVPADILFAEPMISNRERFRGYIHYTNRQIDSIVSGILEKGGGKDIIILQSDHGWDDFVPDKRSNAFRNFSAFYFPGQDYRLLYDSISNVNTFRVVLNQFFKQELPLLPDRSYYLK